MKKEKRFLITTPDEATWKFDQPVVFLNEWCRLNNRKHIWNNLDAVVLDPYNFETIEQKVKHHTNIKKINDKIFLELCVLLNKHHNTNYSHRFWLILIGPWLKNFVRLIIYKIITLKKCINEFEISGVTNYKYNFSSLITMDSISSENSFRNNKWNVILNCKILNLLDGLNFSTNFINEKNNLNLSQYLNFNLIEEKSLYKKIFEKSFKIYSLIAKKFVRKNDVFILNSYLPLIQEIKLELALGQIPQIWKLNQNRVVYSQINQTPNQVLRDNLKQKISEKFNDELENIVSLLLFDLLPVCYLEGFISLNEVVKDLPWPKKPKVIFTSNNYFYDEVFKLWTAKKVESGGKYYIGQHGNNLGTRWDLIDCIEEVTSDKFLTWGWKQDKDKHLPSFIFKTADKRKKIYNKSGSLLLIENNISQSIYFDNYKHQEKYFINQLKFVKNLAKAPREKLIIRLYKDSNNTIKLSDEVSMWLQFDSKLKIDKFESDINNLILNARIIVHSYDSTSMLETLSQNIPTLAFWENSHDDVIKGGGLDHLRDSVKPNYQMLIDVGIIHLSSKSVADKVNEIWDDVSGWWSQESIQVAREKFCKIYANNKKNPVIELKKILLS